MAPYGSSFVFGPGFFGFLGPRLGGVRSSFLDRHQVHQVGDRHHREYWIPAEELAEFELGDRGLDRGHPEVSLIAGVGVVGAGPGGEPPGGGTQRAPPGRVRITREVVLM